ncbi:hypothetical protein EK904_002203, partial [Melospiza melodia maxima]
VAVHRSAVSNRHEHWQGFTGAFNQSSCESSVQQLPCQQLEKQHPCPEGNAQTSCSLCPSLLCCCDFSDKAKNSHRYHTLSKSMQVVLPAVFPSLRVSWGKRGGLQIQVLSEHPLDAEPEPLK